MMSSRGQIQFAGKHGFCNACPMGQAAVGAHGLIRRGPELRVGHAVNETCASAIHNQVELGASVGKKLLMHVLIMDSAPRLLVAAPCSVTDRGEKRLTGHGQRLRGPQGRPLTTDRWSTAAQSRLHDGQLPEGCAVTPQRTSSNASQTRRTANPGCFLMLGP